MGNEKDVVFRNASGGYNKSDVNTYIARMAQEFSRRSEDWETEKLRLNRSIEEEMEAIKKMESEKEDSEVKCKEALAKLEGQSEMLLDVQKQNEALQAEKEALSEKLLEAEIQISELDGVRDSLSAEQKKNRELSNEKQSLSAEILALKEKASALEKAEIVLSEEKTKNGMLSLELSAAKAMISEVQEKADNLLKEKEDIQSALTAAKDTIAAHKEEIEALKNNAHDEKKNADGLVAEKDTVIAELEKRLAVYAEKDEEHISFYNKLNEHVEKIMATANANAKKIVAAALAKSDEIVAQAEKNAEKIRIDATEQTERAKGIYQNAAVGYYDEVMRFASEIRESFGKLTTEISARKAEVDDELLDMRAETVHNFEIPGTSEIRLGVNISPKKNPLFALDSKMESLFHDSMNAINDMAGK